MTLCQTLGKNKKRKRERRRKMKARDLGPTIRDYKQLISIIVYLKLLKAIKTLRKSYLRIWNYYVL